MKKGNTHDANRYKNATTVIRNKLKYDHSRIAEASHPPSLTLDGFML